jgi:Na+-driven multidrug efflux pump
VLLAARIPLAGISVLTAALAADGAPGATSIGEGIALLITVPGLILLLPTMGGLGAALVSLVAYGTSVGVQLALIRRRLGGTVRSYVLPHRADIRWARELLASAGFRHR